ncbi:fumarylacetoacetate hydrolase family protein [Gonapodya prolifera JEL478]|uniref:Fumarylacetoacetate hydrolase family protein n=1 Tax=Gonapodya prolifera (strain JEL478) TaxID=1344416 RepID=A0A139A4N2_GONPJ|nr:fumarylacetoacetate hydrolase family protein [Gonapodya prolifera JEL478]|eukprot:KXS11694.1 fumarylacetoacetate hydrolase family protein [Gonapodya prolifera JEL478]
MSRWSRLIRFEAVEGGIHYGQPTAASLLPNGSLDTSKVITATEVVGGPFEGTVGTRSFTVKKLLAPLETAPVIACIGLNYRLHAKEGGNKIPDNPVLFHKYPNSLAGPGPIELADFVNDKQMDYEAELTVVIGKAGKNIPKEKALDHILAYTCGNDLSARKWQRACGGQFNFGKGMDNFAPIGPQLVSSSVITDPQNLRLRCVLNGKTMQDETTGDMIFSVAEIVSFLSRGTTLVPGTVIMTGTPSGVGYPRNPPVCLEHGDVCSIEVDGIGSLQNTILYGPTVYETKL